MATIEENVLIIHKDKEGNLHLQYPATKWGNVIDAPSKLPANGGTADYINVHSIAASTDLNSVTTPGIYYCAANATVSSLKNCPTTNAFYLCVGRHAGVYQEIVEYVTANPKKFMRNQYSSTWGSWYREFHTGNPPSKAEVGLGNVPNVTTNDQIPTYSDASSLSTLTSGEKLSIAFGKIKTAITNLINHINNKSNPHAVTKSQVGLGNVPNVTTNDQTPTYTQASTLATLVSGEKLSVSLGKIMKSIADQISHIGNKSNPHGVTKAQVGLGNVDNTSDANKPVSAATLNALNGKAASNHNHNGVYEPVFTKNNAFNKNFGTGVGTVCQGNDARLSDSRTPKAHTHTKSQIADFPASLKNPTALTLKLNGESQTYDGSVARLFDVEVSNPNLLINGDFQVWQRGVTFAINKSKMITADRWCAIYDTASYTIKKDDLGRLQIIPPSSGKCGIYQRVELNSSIISSLKGNKYTLSFHVLSTKEFSLTSSVNILKNDGTSVLLGKIEKLIDANITTKVKYTFSIPSNANFDNCNSLQVILLNDYSIPANVYLSKAKLEIGENATYYTPKSYAEELLMCQRYYAYLRDIYVGRYWTNSYLGLYFPVEMREIPTIKYQKVMSSTWTDVSTQATLNSRTDKRGFRSVSTISEDGPLLTIQYLELDAEIY